MISPDAPASEESPSGSLGVLEPILNSPFKKPKEHWLLNVGEEPKKLADRRPSLAYPPQTGELTWTLGSTLAPSVTYRPAMEMMLVNLIRQRVEEWRDHGYPGVTRTTLELLQWWTRGAQAAAVLRAGGSCRNDPVPCRSARRSAARDRCSAG